LTVSKKNPHAVALGRKGGKAGTGKSKARPSEQARKAALKRWYPERIVPIVLYGRVVKTEACDFCDYKPQKKRKH
jgi:hypothetical protein